MSQSEKLNTMKIKLRQAFLFSLLLLVYSKVFAVTPAECFQSAKWDGQKQINSNGFEAVQSNPRRCEENQPLYIGRPGAIPAVAMYRQSARVKALNQRVQDWKSRYAEVVKLPIEQKAQKEADLAQEIHAFLLANIKYKTDMEHWHQPDYWATPIESFATGAGDCEDFAFANYFIQREIGVPANRLRIVFVRKSTAANPGVSESHMVVALYPEAPVQISESPSDSRDGEAVIIDNFVSHIRPQHLRQRELAPIFAFNETGLREDFVSLPGCEAYVNQFAAYSWSQWAAFTPKIRSEFPW
jgi:predicted transglutaminase-like cysteine proteinase